MLYIEGATPGDDSSNKEFSSSRELSSPDILGFTTRLSGWISVFRPDTMSCTRRREQLGWFVTQLLLEWGNGVPYEETVGLKLFPSSREV
jgi:hypothetical protein